MERTCGCSNAPGPSTGPIWPLPASSPSAFGMEQETSKLRPLLSIEALYLPTRRVDLLVVTPTPRPMGPLYLYCNWNP